MDFPSGPVVSSLLTNAGNTDLIPGLGSAHTLQLLKSVCSGACMQQLLSLLAANTEAHAPTAHALTREAPAMRRLYKE